MNKQAVKQLRKLRKKAPNSIITIEIHPKNSPYEWRYAVSLRVFNRDHFLRQCGYKLEWALEDLREFVAEETKKA